MTTKPTHTPGPWRVDPSWWGDIQTGDGRFEICTVDCDGDNDHAFPSPDRDEAEANARLIAAAPDLLVALKDLLEVDSDDDSNVEARCAARAAISKAEGGGDE